MLDLERIMQAFHRACEKAGVAYALTGGAAVSVWAEPRASTDVDALVVVDPKALPSFVTALASEGLSCDVEGAKVALAQGEHFSIFDESSVIHVDAKPALKPHERHEVEEAVEVVVKGARLRFVAPETLIAFKLKFGSPRDLRDARLILDVQGDRIERDRLASWAVRLGVTDKLDRLLAGESDEAE